MSVIEFNKWPIIHYFLLLASTNRKSSKRSKEELSENEETSNSEMIELKIEEKRMMLRKHAVIKAWAAEAKAKKLKVEAEPLLEIVNFQRKKKNESYV